MKLSRLLSNSSQQYLQNQFLKTSINSTLSRMLERLLKSFIGSDELQVWQTKDCYGNNWWHAYDPVTSRHTVVDSEEQLRAWIEQRYYH